MPTKNFKSVSTPGDGPYVEAYFDGLSGGGGTTYTGTAPISVSGSKISLTPATPTAAYASMTVEDLCNALHAAGLLAEYSE